MAEQAITALGRLLGWLQEPSGHHPDHEVQVRAVMSEEAPVPAQARDISRGGIRLRVPRAFSLGTLLSIEFPSVITVLATVIHDAAPEQDVSVLACVFTSELGDEHLRAFGAKQQRTASADKRRWVRFPCDAKVYYHLAAAAEPSERLGRVINISPSGVNLLVTQATEVGSLLGMRLPDKNGQYSFLILACVVHSTPQAEGEFALGCTFIRELNLDEFQDLKE